MVKCPLELLRWRKDGTAQGQNYSQSTPTWTPQNMVCRLQHTTDSCAACLANYITQTVLELNHSFRDGYLYFFHIRSDEHSDLVIKRQ